MTRPEESTTLTHPASYPTTATVGDVMAGYLAFGAKGRWKSSTGKMMQSMSSRHILPNFGTREVRSIEQVDVLQWYDEVKRRTSSSRMALSTLSGMMHYAEDHGLRRPGTNPCRGLRKKVISTRGSHLPPIIIRDLWKVLDQFQQRMPDACDLVRLLLLTGARKGEMLGLGWHRVEGVRAVLENSKTGVRTIWLNAPARALLDARRPACGEGFVFPSPRGDGHRASVDREWKLIREAAGLWHLRLHDLRHHYAAVGVSNGIDLKVVGSLLGHHEIDSSLTYAHLATSALVKSADRVSGLIGRAITADGNPRPKRGRPQMPLPHVAASSSSSVTEATHA